MKVAEVMEKDVDYVLIDTPVEEVSRIIFGRRINGLPVCKDKKVVGFITERDILAKFYPTIQEYIEDRVHAWDFEKMEEKIEEIFALKAQEIMNKNPTVITPDTPLLRAQSLMFIQKVGRLPVVDKEGNLIGILSKGDIFKALVGRKIPYLQDEEYHDWVAKYYDLTVHWEERLGYEIPDLTSLFKKEGIKKVIDIGCGTGEHVIALSREGFEITGIERSSLMAKTAQKKWEKLSPSLKKKARFLKVDFINYFKETKEKFQAAILMGNSLAHNLNWQELLKITSQALERKSLMIIQLANFSKILKTNKRFQDFNIARIVQDRGKELAFLEFYDPPRGKEKNLTLNMAILLFDGEKWGPKDFNSTPIANINKENILPFLQKLGFEKISFFGSNFWGPLFSSSFELYKHDWLNILAKRE